MALERTYNVPLRKEWLKVPRHQRTRKAVKALREFLKRHMKGEEIKIGKHLNEHLWKHSIKNPPHHVKINAVKDDKGVVKAELVGAPTEKKEDKERKKGKEAKKKEEDREEKKEEAKEEKEKEEKSKEEQKSEEKIGEINSEENKNNKQSGRNSF